MTVGSIKMGNWSRKVMSNVVLVVDDELEVQELFEMYFFRNFKKRPLTFYLPCLEKKP